MNGPLVTRAEMLLADGGLLALLAGAAIRLAAGKLLWGSNFALLPLQIIAGSLLVIAINLGGLLLPRRLSGWAVFCGLLGWAFALTLLPRYLWPTRHSEPALVWIYVALAAATFVARTVLQRRWLGELRGHGWAWIEHWGQERSLRARATARRALITLGYERARQRGQPGES